MRFDVDYYKILEADFGTDETEMKKKYRKLSKKYHPDKNNNDDTYFKLLAEAYSVLCNGDKRAEYDNKSKYGKHYDDSIELFDFDFSNENLTTGKYQKRFNEFKQKDIIDILIKLKTYQRDIVYDRYVNCTKCHGTGFDDAEEIECDFCDTTGMYNDVECPSCNGNGYVKLGFQMCSKCSGEKLILKKENIKLYRKHINNGRAIFDYKGNYSKITPSKVGKLYIIIEDEYEDKEVK